MRWQSVVRRWGKKPETTALPDEITADEFFIRIQKHYFFFNRKNRKITVTGDVDLSRLRNKYLMHLDLGHVTFKGKFNASGLKLEGVNCQGATFEKDAIFDGADIRGVNFKDTKFKADFHIDQKTNVGKRGKFFNSAYKTNARTEKTRNTFNLSTVKTTLPDIGFKASESNVLTVYVAKCALSERDAEVSRFWKQFTAQYKSVCSKDAFRKFRGNIVSRLEKKNPPLSDAEKIYEIVRHAQREPGGRTDRALKAILPHFVKTPSPAVVARDEVHPLSVDAPIPDYEDIDAAAALLQQVLQAPQNFLKRKRAVDSALQLIRTKNGDDDPTVQHFLKISDGIEKKFTQIQGAFHQKNVDVLQNLRLSVFDKHMLEIMNLRDELNDSIVEAEKILNSALLDFKQGVYLFGREDSESKREADKNKVVASYLFLKTAGETEAVAKYDGLLRDDIYPNYLRFALRPAKEKAERNGVPKFRYNLAEELFIRSGAVDDASRLAVESDHRHEVGGGAGLFVRKESASRDVFENSCLKRWTNISLSGLKQAGLVDLAIFDVVQEKMKNPVVNDQNHLCVERIFYLEELIKCEKFDDAIREAKAIKAAYGEQLVVPFGQTNPLKMLLDTALNNTVAEIKSRIVRESKQMLAHHQPEPDHLLNKADAICSARSAALAEILTAIGGPCAPMRFDISNMYSAISHGATNTYALKTIADSVLADQPFDHSLLLILDPKENYYPIVWVGEDDEKVVLARRLKEQMEREKNPSRKVLLRGLINCIAGMEPVSGLLSVPLKIDDVTSKINHKDIVLMNHGAIGVQYAIQLFEKAFEPLWNYGPIKKAITRSETGMVFADPTKLETKKLISGSEINFLKYGHVVMLHDALLMIRKNFSRDNMHHENITKNFAQLINTLSSVRDQIVALGENGKTFDGLIQGVLAAVKEAQANWLEYYDSTIEDAHLSQHRERSRAITCTPV